MLNMRLRNLLDSKSLEKYATELNNIDGVKLADDTVYRLDVARVLRELHNSAFDGVSISKVLLELIDTGVRFTKLELSAIEKINLICNTGGIRYQEKPAGYDSAINGVILGTMAKSLDNHRYSDFKGAELVKVTDVDSYNGVAIHNEVENLLVYAGLDTYISILRLTISVFMNVVARDI